MNIEPKAPYVFQPFGSTETWRGDRLYGVSGVAIGTTITGLTKEEAQAVLDALHLVVLMRRASGEGAQSESGGT